MKMMIGENCLRTMRVVADVVGALPLTGGTMTGAIMGADEEGFIYKTQDTTNETGRYVRGIGVESSSPLLFAYKISDGGISAGTHSSFTIDFVELSAASDKGKATLSVYPDGVFIDKLVTPTTDTMPTPKSYVDNAIASKADLVSGKVPSSQLPEMNYAKTDLSNVAFALDFKSSASLGTTLVWTSVAYGNDLFIAVASGTNKYARSSDGHSWTLVSTSGTTSTTLPSSANWQSITYGNGKFVAVAYNSNQVAYSSDGRMWFSATLPSSANWQSITYGNGKFVAVAGNGGNEVAYSVNGVNWTVATMPISANWSSVAYDKVIGKFVVVLYGLVSAYSIDGANWSLANMPSSANWSSVTHGDGVFVAVASGSNKAAYSTDGINWTATTLPATASWISVTYGDGMFVAVAYGSNNVARSTDGINWTAATLPSSANWQSIGFGNGMFVVVAKNSSRTAYAIAIPSVVDQLSAVGMARMEIGSYVGLGFCGSGNPNKLSFNFKPKVLMLYGKSHNYMCYGFLIYPMANSGPKCDGMFDFETVTWDGCTVSWYDSRSQGYQANYSGETYYYIAIG